MILLKLKNVRAVILIMSLLSVTSSIADVYKSPTEVKAENTAKYPRNSKSYRDKYFLSNPTKNKYYVSLKSGPSSLSLDKNSFSAKPKNDAMFDLEGGYIFNKFLSAGIDFSISMPYKYTSNSESTGNMPGMLFNTKTKFRFQSLIANIYCNLFSNDKLIVPYVGGGIGASRNIMSDYYAYSTQDNSLVYYKEGTTNTGFAWDLIAGGMINLNQSKNLKLDVQYKYANLGVAKTKSYDISGFNGAISEGNVKKTKLKVQSILVGLKYEF